MIKSILSEWDGLVRTNLFQDTINWSNDKFTQYHKRFHDWCEDKTLEIGLEDGINSISTIYQNTNNIFVKKRGIKINEIIYWYE